MAAGGLGKRNQFVSCSFYRRASGVYFLSAAVPGKNRAFFQPAKAAPTADHSETYWNRPAVRYSGGNEFGRIGKHCDCSALVVRSAPRRGSRRHGRGSRDRLDGVYGSASA